VAGSEVNDDPFAPVSRFARDLIAERGPDTPIDWLARDQRYVEKLATPDVTIADIIGDLDPIKAARGGHVLSDELTMHYGLLPRANRGIFTINELPDLAGKIQVGLLNILQEGDIQIKGYPIRLGLDILMGFTANPEDYTARGKIITPLKDRIGAEVLTHYPATLELGMAITEQEAWVNRGGHPVRILEFVSEVVEQVAFEARADKRVDQRSGVSQRLPISVLELAVSNAEQRVATTGTGEVVPRIEDVIAALPAITGKLELEYEGELQGADTIALALIRRAVGRIFEQRAGGADCEEIVAWFDQGGALKLSGNQTAEASLAGFATVPGLVELVGRVGLAASGDTEGAAAASEFILEGLTAHNRISKDEAIGYNRQRVQRREPPKEPGIGLG